MKVALMLTVRKSRRKPQEIIFKINEKLVTEEVEDLFVAMTPEAIVMSFSQN